MSKTNLQNLQIWPKLFNENVQNLQIWLFRVFLEGRFRSKAYRFAYCLISKGYRGNL